MQSAQLSPLLKLPFSQGDDQRPLKPHPGRVTQAHLLVNPREPSPLSTYRDALFGYATLSLLVTMLRGQLWQFLTSRPEELLPTPQLLVTQLRALQVRQQAYGRRSQGHCSQACHFHQIRCAGRRSKQLAQPRPSQAHLQMFVLTL